MQAVALALLVSTASAEPGVRRYTGVAYDLTSGRHLYTERHEQRLDGQRLVEATVSYFAADGTPLGAKTLDFRGDPYVPTFRLELPGEGYSEGIIRNLDPIVMVRSQRNERERAERVDRDSLVAADAGFHQYIKANLPALAEGRILRLRLAVAGHLDTYSVRVRRAEDAQIEGRPALRIRVEHDSILRFVLDPVELFYDPDSRRLLEYRGTSNLHDPATGDPYEVRISYQAEEPDP